MNQQKTFHFFSSQTDATRWPVFKETVIGARLPLALAASVDGRDASKATGFNRQAVPRVLTYACKEPDRFALGWQHAVAHLDLAFTHHMLLSGKKHLE